MKLWKMLQFQAAFTPRVFLLIEDCSRQFSWETDKLFFISFKPPLQATNNTIPCFCLTNITFGLLDLTHKRTNAKPSAAAIPRLFSARLSSNAPQPSVVHWLLRHFLRTPLVSILFSNSLRQFTGLVNCERTASALPETAHMVLVENNKKNLYFFDFMLFSHLWINFVSKQMLGCWWQTTLAV